MLRSQKNVRHSMLSSVRNLTVAAMLVAMSVVIGTFCKTFLDFGGLLRITFENLPILLSGLLFGPVVGGLVGGATDLVSYLFSPQPYPLNLVVTVGATLIGVISGLVSHYVIRKPSILQIVLSCGTAHLVGSMIVKSIGLYQIFGWGVLIRIPMYVVIATIEIFVICLLFRRSRFWRMMGGACEQGKEDA